MALLSSELPLVTPALSRRSWREEKVQDIVQLLPLLKDPHSEFVLLRSCLSLPKIMFMLRAVNTTAHQLSEFDSIIRGALSHIFCSPLTDEQWAQASLPVAMGGLGLRSAVDHAPTAHAVSLLAAQPLLDGLLGEDEEEPGSKQRGETFVVRNHCTMETF